MRYTRRNTCLCQLHVPFHRYKEVAKSAADARTGSVQHVGRFRERRKKTCKPKGADFFKRLRFCKQITQFVPFVEGFICRARRVLGRTALRKLRTRKPALCERGHQAPPPPGPRHPMLQTQTFLDIIHLHNSRMIGVTSFRGS
jgi:hypothetical protein